MISPRAAPIFVIGEGQGALQRLRLVDEYDAPDVFVFAPSPCAELTQIAGSRLCAHWPHRNDFADRKPRLVFVADTTDDAAKAFSVLARDAGALVNVHDRTPLCDFHVPARLRRGVLQIAVATDGKVPALSRMIRDRIAALIGPQWGDHAKTLGETRARLLAQGVRGGDLSRQVADVVRNEGWLS
ncbi:MAG: hypothetical protein KDE14_01430 [Rhodobacteraceae bacterium]|nr:hypothetical protein [Paracoccaceae bacterium]